MIRLTNVRLDPPSEAVRGDRPHLLEDLDLELSRGESVAVIGSNGAGKSLLLQILAGLRQPSAGTVVREPDDLRAGLVFQAPDDQIVGSSVERDLAFGLENLGVPTDEMHERVEKMLTRIGLVDRRHDPPHLLSEGEKQRLALGGALLLEPGILLLDEPTSRLDPEARHVFLAQVDAARRAGTTIVHVTHRSEEVLPADRILALRAGRLAFDGTPAELLAFAELPSLGVRWSPLHELRRELDARGVALPSPSGDDWNDPVALLAALDAGSLA